MIDLRSDTVTKPSQAMLEAMLKAEVGDDVYGDDPSVNELESWAANQHEFEAALFCSSGTQANLLALMAHCDRGDEYLCGQQAHNYKFEGGGAAVLGSIQPQPIENEKDGSLCFKKLASAIKPADSHFANTRLLSLENTINGKVLDINYLAKARAFVDQHGLALHLDGARIYNASVALNLDASLLTKHFDSVSICLSKGLGAPVGSLLLADKALITKARRWRKVLGGGMRQAGILAKAGLFALQNNVERLAQDHDNAKLLANELDKMPEFSLNPDNVQTNLVFAHLDKSIDQDSLITYLLENGIRMSKGQPMRFATHLDVTSNDISYITDTLKRFFSSK